jgi:hypothetical protein
MFALGLGCGIAGTLLFLFIYGTMEILLAAKDQDQ